MGVPIQLLDPNTYRFSQEDKVYREGIELEKGVVITEDFLERNKELLKKSWELYTVYPDIYLDMISTTDTVIHLFPYQRVFLRVCMRYKNIFITAARATSKSFLSILAKYMQCIFIPGHRGMIVAPTITQAVKIAKQKLDEIWRNWPLLEREIESTNISRDYITIKFKNGSEFSVVGAVDSSRGLRMHSGFLDEARDLDGEVITEIILPQLNVSRRMPNGLVNQYESINQQIIYATSAGMKSSYSYEALLDFFIGSIIDPKNYFCLGLDYRIPVLHGLVDGSYVKKLKLSSSYNETAFAAEYLSQWVGGSEESWFQFSTLSKYRIIKNPEWQQKNIDNKDVFYLISVDVARTSGGDQSVACVLRVNRHGEKFVCSLVYAETLGRQVETRTFERQAMDIKLLIEKFNPREVVIDTNGLGVGLADFMIKEQTDALGHVYPAYGFFNNQDYKAIQPKNALPILYSMKANGPLNSQIHGNAYTRLNSGLVRFLITEQEARAALLSTKIGQKMSVEERVKRLLPHEMTTKLFDQMANLRLKRAGMDIVLEQINSRFPKDAYSSFAYGLWRVKELEEEEFKRKKRRQGLETQRKLVFYTGGD